MAFRNGMTFFDPGWSVGVKGQGQTLKTFEVEYLKNGTR